MMLDDGEPSSRVLHVRGSAYARGFQQGRTWRLAIRQHRDLLLATLARVGVADPSAHLSSLVRRSTFQADIQAHCPHLLDEVQGIADGAEIAFDRMFELQLLDEEWAFRSKAQATEPLEKCSSIGLHLENDLSWIGQNMDLGGYTHGLQRFVQHRRSDGLPSVQVFTIAGIIALMGVNGRGVGVCVNSLPQLPAALRGLPVAFMVRRLLEARSAAEAAAWCRALPHATHQHYLIADAREVFSFEASSAGVSAFEPRTVGRVFHTNHPLTSHRRVRSIDETNSRARLASISARLETGAPRAEDIWAALSAFDDPLHPVCRVLSSSLGNTAFTTGSMISVLRKGPAKVESWVSFGPPNEGRYVHASLDSEPQ